jgi:hypothetical protein
VPQKINQVNKCSAIPAARTNMSRAISQIARRVIDADALCIDAFLFKPSAKTGCKQNLPL